MEHPGAVVGGELGVAAGDGGVGQGQGFAGAADQLRLIVGQLESGELTFSSQFVESPTPRAFGLATLSASDVVLAEDESAVLQAFHEHVLEEIGEKSGRNHQ